MDVYQGGITAAGYNCHRVIFFMCLNVPIHHSGSGARGGDTRFQFVV